MNSPETGFHRLAVETQQRNKTRKTDFIKLTGLFTSKPVYPPIPTLLSDRQVGVRDRSLEKFQTDPTDGFNEVVETPKYGMWDSSFLRARLEQTSLFLLFETGYGRHFVLSLFGLFTTL